MGGLERKNIEKKYAYLLTLGKQYEDLTPVLGPVAMHPAG